MTSPSYWYWHITGGNCWPTRMFTNSETNFQSQFFTIRCEHMFISKVHESGGTMEHHVTQISRDDLEDLRDAFNKIGSFPTWHTYTHTLSGEVITHSCNRSSTLLCYCSRCAMISAQGLQRTINHNSYIRYFYCWSCWVQTLCVPEVCSNPAVLYLWR